MQKTIGFFAVLLIFSASVVASGFNVAGKIGAFAQRNETAQVDSNITNPTSISQINQTLTVPQVSLILRQSVTCA